MMFLLDHVYATILESLGDLGEWFTDEECICEVFARYESLSKDRLSPCYLCAYDPPSSFDGKPCSMCPATPKECEDE